ncbi:MAG: LLM class oxidoreductase [Pseudomonadota bacterium]
MNAAYAQVFQPNRLSIGLVVPIESYAASAVPTMQRQIERIQLAERLGFSAVWLRDVPFNVPSFGDAGQLYDPFVYLGALALSTSNIALGVASIILPLRHPAHVAKAAASVDALSGGRLLLGVASGDRPEEYPAMGVDFDSRGERFRSGYEYLQEVLGDRPELTNPNGCVGGGLDMLPKPSGHELPLLITGHSQQSPEWVAQHGHGWMMYPRSAVVQQRLIRDYRSGVAAGHEHDRPIHDRPVLEPLYIDLDPDSDRAPMPIHLGFRLGINALRNYLHSRQAIGVNHVMLNLRFNQSNVEDALQTIAREVMPAFHQSVHQVPGI